MMFGIRCSIAASVLFVLCACKVPTAPSNPAGDGVAALQFQDVVVPDGLGIHEGYHESHSAEEAGWRFGHFEYSGQTRVEEASAHVLQRMPQHAWKLISDEQPDAQTRLLKFARGRYTAAYNLHRQDGITTMIVDYRTTTQDTQDR